MSTFEDGCYGSLKGIALIAKALAGRCRIHYTRVAAGKGAIPEGMTPKTMDEPPDYVMDAMISEVTNPIDGECQVTVQISSADVEAGFYVTGLLLYAEDPDEGEVPFTYLVLENEPEWIRPASSIVGKLATFDVIAAVGDVDTVSATIDPNALVTYRKLKELIDALGTRQLPITIPADGWQDNPDGGAYAYRADIPVESVTAKLIPQLFYPPESAERAGYYGLSPVCETLDGLLRVWSKAVPAEPIPAVLNLTGDASGYFAVGDGNTGSGTFTLPPATENTLGGVKVGSGLNVTRDGTLSVNAATEAEVNEMLTGVLTSENT